MDLSLEETPHVESGNNWTRPCCYRWQASSLFGDRGRFLIHSATKARLTHRNPDAWSVHFLESSPRPRAQYGSASEAGYKRGRFSLSLPRLPFSCFQLFKLGSYRGATALPCQLYAVENHLVPGTLDYGRSQRSHPRP